MNKQEYVESVFTGIAPVYDRMNEIMTFGLVKKWRWEVVQKSGLGPGDSVLDVCTGTGEMAFLLADVVGMTGEVIGLDICKEMLNIAQKKQRLFEEKATLKKQVVFIEGNALALPFNDNKFNCVMSTLSLRNITDISKAVEEMVRVCKKNGRVICLEISEPVNVLLKLGFRFYFHKFIPFLGGLVGQGERIAGGYPPYTWLSQSLKGFPQGKEMARLFYEAGLYDIIYYPLSGGVVTLYLGTKM